jgi:hypothetical protein
MKAKYKNDQENLSVQQNHNLLSSRGQCRSMKQIRNNSMARVPSSISNKKEQSHPLTYFNANCVRQLTGTLLPSCGAGYRRFLMSKVHFITNVQNSPEKNKMSSYRFKDDCPNQCTQWFSLGAPNTVQKSEFSTRFRTRLSTSTLDDFKIGKAIGQGAYAEVKECVYIHTGAEYAMKIYDKIKLIDLQKKKNVIREIHNIEQLHHSNIMQLFHVIDSPKQVILILELIRGRPLKYVIRDSPKGIGEQESARLIGQIISAINYCHSKNIIHR